MTNREKIEAKILEIVSTYRNESFSSGFNVEYDPTPDGQVVNEIMQIIEPDKETKAEWFFAQMIGAQMKGASDDL